MSNDDFNEEKYEEEAVGLSGVFWLTLILGFFFPLLWFFTVMAFYEFLELESKKEKHDRKNKPKISFWQKIKNAITTIFNCIIIIIIIGIVIFFLF